MTNPVPGYAVTTPYGRRGPYWSCDEDSAGNGIHTGADYAAPVGTKVVAARPGTANYSNHGSAFGYHQLDIIAGDGTRDFYAHMTTRTVADGARVDAGQAVGKVGAEGNVTGAHLHFERHATEYGGWSCSVVRDPAPSINYLPSGSSGAGGGGQDDDMADYAHAKRTKPTALKDGEWYVIEWDGDSSDKWFDGPGIKVAGKRVNATLTVHVNDRANDAVVQTSWVESEDGDPKETWPTAALGAFAYVADSRVGSVGDGRRLRARVRVVGGDGTLERADVNVLVFG